MKQAPLLSTAELADQRLAAGVEEPWDLSDLRPRQSPPRWYRRWLRAGRQRHRATRFSQVLAAELIGQTS